MQGGEIFKTYAPSDPHLVDDLLANGVEIKAIPPEQPSMLMQFAGFFWSYVAAYSCLGFLHAPNAGWSRRWSRSNEFW